MTPERALQLRQGLALAGAIAAFGTAAAVAPTLVGVTTEHAKDAANKAAEVVGPHAEKARASLEQTLEDLDASSENADRALGDFATSQNAALLAVSALFVVGVYQAGNARGQRVARARSTLQGLEAFRPEVSANYQSGHSKPRWDLALTNSTGQAVANVSARVRALVEVSDIGGQRRYATKEGFVAMGALEAGESRSVTVNAPDLANSRSFDQRARDLLTLPVDAEKPEEIVNLEVVGWTVTMGSGQQMAVDQSNPRRPAVLRLDDQVITNANSTGLSQL